MRSLPDRKIKTQFPRFHSSVTRRLASGLLALVMLMVAVVGGGVPVLAATTEDKKTEDTKPAAQNTGTLQSYAADSQLQVGTMVMLASEGDKSKVAPVTSDKVSQMYGLVADPRTQSVTVSNTSLKNETYVASTGTYQALVSTQNGPINTGDYVTISAVDGVAMLALPEQKLVFGRAAGSFDGKRGVISTVPIKEKGGQELSKAAIGSIPVVIDIRRNPNEKSTKADLPQFLQRLGEAVAEKPVGPLRIYLSIGITGICVVAAIVILYSGIRSSLISIGRNPLSKKSIFRGLVEIILTALIILITGLFAVYLLLKL